MLACAASLRTPHLIAPDACWGATRAAVWQGQSAQAPSAAWVLLAAGLRAPAAFLDPLRILWPDLCPLASSQCTLRAWLRQAGLTGRLPGRLPAQPAGRRRAGGCDLGAAAPPGARGLAGQPQAHGARRGTGAARVLFGPLLNAASGVVPAARTSWAMRACAVQVGASAAYWMVMSMARKSAARMSHSVHGLAAWGEPLEIAKPASIQTCTPPAARPTCMLWRCAAGARRPVRAGPSAPDAGAPRRRGV